MRLASGKVLAALTLAALLLQVWLVPPIPRWMDTEDEFYALGLFLGLFLPLVCVATGRVVLAFLPPGEVGGHAPRELAATLATSLVLGFLAFCPLEGLIPGGAYPFYALVLVLALVRWATLPGAMVPRHAVAREPGGPLADLLALVSLAWALLIFASVDGVLGSLWLALGVLLFHGLGVARRRRAGRYAVLAAMALAFAAFAMETSIERLLPASSLTVGAVFLIAWLRRADRRAGALAGIGFGSAFLGGADPLAFAGVLVFVLASLPRQRAFACAWTGSAAALSWLVASLAASSTVEPRGRLLLAEEMGRQVGLWGIAWPVLLAALGLGALTFEWGGPAWRPGAIEVPRREARSIAALFAACAAALLLPFSPWFEGDALVILFPLGALLSGLLLIPPERVAGGA